MSALQRIYITGLPVFSIFSTFMGIDIGISANKRLNDGNISNMNQYANVIGYTGLGIITGITYPVSYPLFGLYILSLK